MKKILHSLLFCLLVSTILFGCKEDDTDNSGSTNDYNYTEILDEYVNSTVIPTYASMKDNSKLLLTYVKAFQSSGLQSDLDLACQAWKATRKPWEQSEGFLFGPASTYSLDPLLDSWPLDQNQLDQVLTSSVSLTADYVRDGLGAVLRGFHTIEYLLFRDGATRQASTVSDREKEYLSAVSEVLRDDCVKLWAYWHGDSDGIGEDDQAILNALEIKVGDGFGMEFKLSGKVGSRYLSQKDAIDEIIQGCMDIADEVANGKIADPYNSGAGDITQEESRWSWNSLTDFKNNILSIKNALYGGVDDDSRSSNSLASLVDSINPELSTELKKNIDKAITAIEAIPEPFCQHYGNSVEIEEAMGAISDIIITLESISGLLE